MEKEVLRKIGLTDSESKVYLALLKLGDFSSKGKILAEARIAPSKIYHVLDKLIEKGLASTIIKNNVKHFLAASPNKIKDYIVKKKQEICREEREVDAILPKLNEYYKNIKIKTKAEIFIGWHGMDTAYTAILDTIKKDQIVYVLGASGGVDKEKTKKFFLRYSPRYKLKGAKIKIIYNENSRDYVKELEGELGSKFNKKFLFKTTPVEIAFTEGVAAITILKEEPIVILVHDKETSNSFKTYFEELWKIAKK